MDNFIVRVGFAVPRIVANAAGTLNYKLGKLRRVAPRGNAEILFASAREKWCFRVAPAGTAPAADFLKNF